MKNTHYKDCHCYECIPLTNDGAVKEIVRHLEGRGNILYPEDIEYITTVLNQLTNPPTIEK